MALWVYFIFAPYTWRVGDIYLDSTIEDLVLTLAFGWLALRSDRWWPFAATAACGLSLLVHGLTVTTDITWGAAVSARVGLGLLFYLSLAAGVWERWLAGETPAIHGAQWRPRKTP